jgi:hypothetical protein
METILSLFNPLKEEFTFRWDKIPYTVGAGKTLNLPKFLAEHGAKHLVDYIILHQDTWAELGITRKDKGDKINNEGIVTNEPDWTKDREPILKMVLKGEKQLEDESPKTESEKIKEKVKKLNEETNPEFPV